MLMSIGKFAKKIGVTVHTLRNWDKEGSLIPTKVTAGGTRYYSEEQLKNYYNEFPSLFSVVIDESTEIAENVYQISFASIIIEDIHYNTFRKNGGHLEVGFYQEETFTAKYKTKILREKEGEVVVSREMEKLECIS